MKKLIFFVLLGFCLISCQQYEYMRIGDSAFHSLKDKDLISFKDTLTGKTDSFIISLNRGFSKQDAPFYMYFEHISVMYSKKNGLSNYFTISTGIGHYSTSFTTITSIYYLNTNYNSGPSFSQHYDTLKIDNVIYRGVVTTTLNTANSTSPSKISFSDTDGVLSYGFSDGRLYNLVGK